MEILTGYELVEPIVRDASLSVFRARKKSDSGLCIVKCATSDDACEETFRFLKNEYAITSRLPITGIIKSREIIRKDNGVFLVQEPTIRVPLSCSMFLWKENIRLFLISAMQLCTLLDKLHKHNIIHKNISPDSIFVDPGTGECVLTNFYVSVWRSDEVALVQPQQYYVHSLPYISPEQTGRTNYPIDARADFYSLGIVFYEMLTGQMPFVASDPMEFMYSHVAKHPAPPEQHVPSIPKVLSDIVLKLIAKSPDERYHTALGLKADLEECLYRYDREGAISGIIPGAHDYAPRLIISETLFERAKELALLGDALKRVSQGKSEALTISGHGGIGKTRLLDEFRQSLQAESVVLMYGKCTEAASNTPYYALSAALANLFYSVIDQGEQAMALWQERLGQAIGNHCGMIAQVVPELQLIIGPCAAEPAVMEFEAQHRFRTLFIHFLKTFVRKNEVLVLIIDDLQWADSALLNIVKPAFFDDSEGAVLLIGSGRLQAEAAEEIGQSFHGLGCAVTRIDLLPLSREATRDIIIGSLHCSEEKAHALAGVLYEKTRGNPLFLKEYLKMLHSRGFLHRIDAFSGKNPTPGESGWEWDIERIRQLEISENVIGVVTDEFSLISQESQMVMEWAICSGAEFYPQMISKASGIGLGRVAACLHECVEKGIVRASTGGRLPTFQASSEKSPYRFSHDRVREALATRIDKRKQCDMHLHVGRLQLLNYWEGSEDTSIFEIVNHFNPFEAELSSAEERRDLVNLNIDAGKRAMNASAYEIALMCFGHAARFLPADSWKTAHSLRFKIELLSAESECLLGRLDVAEKRLDAIDAQECTAWERGSLCQVYVVVYQLRLKYPEALKKAVDGVRALGISFPENPSLFHIAVGMVKALAMMWKIRPASLLRNLPEREPVQPADGQKLTLRLFTKIWEQSFMMNREKLMVAVVLRMIVFSRKYGNQNASAIAYCCWGIFLSMIYRNPGKGLPYAEYACRLADRFDDPFIKGKTCFLHTAFFSHFEGHISGTIDAYNKALSYSAEVGDIINTGMCNEGIVIMNVFVGKPIGEVKKFADDLHAVLIQKGLAEKSLYVFKVVLDWTRSLQTKIIEPGNPFASAVQGEELNLMEKGLFLLFEMYRAFLAGDYAAAARCSESLKGNPFLEPTGYFCAFYYFLDALTTSLPKATGEAVRSGKRIKSLKKRLGQLKRYSDRCPVNFHCFYLLVKAELLRLTQQYWEAAACYQNAIDEAEARGFIHYQALAYEVAARFYLNGNNKYLWKLLMKRAIFCFGEWGADGKVALLREEFPESASLGGGEQGSGVNRLAITGHPSEIDFSAFLKAVEAISTEILLDRLLERLIRIVIEYAGAERGVLILNQDDGLFVRIEGWLALTDPSNRIEAKALSIPLGKATVPQGIITFVHRTREPVRLEHAALKGRFMTDPYVRRTRMKSVLCVPLVKLDRVSGVIYLENSIMEGAFPPSILQLLKLLSGQAVISLENALFHELEMKHLQAKVNPHFIFNALSSIAELCNQNPKEAENAIIKLSVLNRYILAAEMRLVTLEEEIEIVQKYLDIEKLRFGARLKSSIHVMGDPTTVKMPCLLIQPLVENCIRHGISPRSSGGSIVISIVISEKTCAISVADDGIGLNTKRSGAGYGQASIKKRLALHYGTNCSFRVRDANGYIVDLTIPV